jgi:pimeloyl-ACP methyl ester carboxylesterase
VTDLPRALPGAKAGGGEPARVHTPGASFAYEAAGPADGPLVLCVHGFPDHPATFRGLAATLASEGFRVVAPWLRGYAPSTLEGPFDVVRVGADLAELARTLSPSRPAMLVGHDWGAVAAYEALSLHPDAFARAVTLAVPHPLAFARNTVRYPRQLRRSWYMGFLNLPGSASWVARDDFAFVDRLWRDWSPGFAPGDEYMRELKACLARSMPAPILYYRALLRDLPAGLRRARPKIETPTLYLHGSSDGCIGWELAQGQSRFFRAELKEVHVHGAGHFLHLEAPGEVAHEVMSWLRG